MGNIEEVGETTEYCQRGSTTVQVVQREIEELQHALGTALVLHLTKCLDLERKYGEMVVELAVINFKIDVQIIDGDFCGRLRSWGVASSIWM